MSDVILNAAQREALSWFFSSDNHEGEPLIEGEAIDFRVERGIPYVCGCYLHRDGGWATFHPDQRNAVKRGKLSEAERQTIRRYTGSLSVRELANEYGVSESYVRLLRTQAVKEGRA